MTIEKVKNILKRSKILSAINASIKCQVLKKQYYRILNKYKENEQKYSFKELMEQKGFTQKWSESLKNKKPNVYFIGTDEFQDKSGFIQDLSKVSNLTYFCKDDGSYGQSFEVNKRSINTKKAIKDIEQLIDNNEKPDIVLMQAWGDSFHIEDMLKLKKKHNLKFINIALDNRLVHNLISELNILIDLSLVSNPEVVEWYLKDDVPAVFFPMASSLDFYYPMNLEKKYDVGFIGNKYGYREELVTKLKKSGINVEARGSGWEGGRIKLEDNNKFFNECKIILGIGTVGHCKDFYTQKLRDFDAPLSGGVYITHKNKDLNQLYVENEEIILCKTVDEYIIKIKSLLKDDKKLENISLNAYKKASKKHTYEKRFLELFRILNIEMVL